jgi:hypothetical protein
MSAPKNEPTGCEMTQQQYDALLATAIKEIRWEKRFPRDHRIFLAGLIVGLTAMTLVVSYV